jgi:hypothetical protein
MPKMKAMISVIVIAVISLLLGCVSIKAVDRPTFGKFTMSKDKAANILKKYKIQYGNPYTDDTFISSIDENGFTYGMNRKTCETTGYKSGYDPGWGPTLATKRSCEIKWRELGTVIFSSITSIGFEKDLDRPFYKGIVLFSNDKRIITFYGNKDNNDEVFAALLVLCKNAN